MLSVYSADAWDEWVGDEDVGPGIAHDRVAGCAGVCCDAVVDVMMQYVPNRGRPLGWSVADFDRVAVACTATYFVSGDVPDGVYPYGAVGAGWAAARGFVADDDLFVGLSVVAAEVQSGVAVWLECGACGALHRFDRSMVAGYVG